jgi:glycosyltransferase involved in cell wall biosynthesis
MNVYFQSIGLLFHYNFGLTSQLTLYKDVNVTIGTRHLFLYLYGIWYTRYYKNLNIFMTTFPTSFPFRETRIMGSQVADRITELPLYEKIMSRFDVLHLNDRAHPYTRKTAANIKKAKVLTIHWVPSKVDEDYFTKVDALVSPSEVISKYVNEIIGLKPIVIHHGVDTSLFNTTLSKVDARKHLGLPDSKRIVLWIGRIDRNKDLKTLIEAVPMVVKEVPDALFLIKGRTSSKSLLQSAIKYLKSTGTEKNVRIMLGWDFLTKMPYFYRSADVFVHTSQSEVCSFVLLEAMACGVPIVASAIPTLMEIGGNSPLFFETGNPKDLADKTISLLLDDKKSEVSGKNGLEQIKNLGLTLSEVAERYKNLYSSLL